MFGLEVSEDEKHQAWQRLEAFHNPPPDWEETLSTHKCCGERMTEDHATFELRCRGCGKVEELATPFKTRAEMGRVANPISYTNLRRCLEKYGIFGLVNAGREYDYPLRWKFWGNLIHDFREHIFPKSVNYVCFLFNYFQAVPESVWARKNQIRLLLLPVVDKKSRNTLLRAKEKFDEW